MEKYERKLSSSSDGVFGKILTLSSASATIVFISVLIFFLLFEAGKIISLYAYGIQLLYSI